jgi:hypothetical protein
MPMSESSRKQNLLAEIVILVNSLNEQTGLADNPLVYPSKEEAERMTLAELESLKREFRDLSRSLGGLNPR